jgi:hypothetical protein
MFLSSAIVRELVLSLAKVMFKNLCTYRLCIGVAACLGSGVCVVCCAPAYTKVCHYTVPTEIIFSIEIQIEFL